METTTHTSITGSQIQARISHIPVGDIRQLTINEYTPRLTGLRYQPMAKNAVVLPSLLTPANPTRKYGNKKLSKPPVWRRYFDNDEITPFFHFPHRYGLFKPGQSRRFFP